MSFEQWRQTWQWASTKQWNHLSKNCGQAFHLSISKAVSTVQLNSTKQSILTWQDLIGCSTQTEKSKMAFMTWQATSGWQQSAQVVMTQVSLKSLFCSLLNLPALLGKMKVSNLGYIPLLVQALASAPQTFWNHEGVNGKGWKKHCASATWFSILWWATAEQHTEVLPVLLNCWLSSPWCCVLKLTSTNAFVLLEPHHVWLAVCEVNQEKAGLIHVGHQGTVRSKHQRLHCSCTIGALQPTPHCARLTSWTQRKTFFNIVCWFWFDILGRDSQGWNCVWTVSSEWCLGGLTSGHSHDTKHWFTGLQSWIGKQPIKLGHTWVQTQTKVKRGIPAWSSLLLLCFEKCFSITHGNLKKNTGVRLWMEFSSVSGNDSFLSHAIWDHDMSPNKLLSATGAVCRMSKRVFKSQKHDTHHRNQSNKISSMRVAKFSCCVCGWGIASFCIVKFCDFSWSTGLQPNGSTLGIVWDQEKLLPCRQEENFTAFSKTHFKSNWSRWWMFFTD